jgi:hypothetical protein
MDGAVAAFRQGADGFRDLPEKSIACMWGKRPACVHNGSQFGVGEADRL